MSNNIGLGYQKMKKLRKYLMHILNEIVKITDMWNWATSEHTIENQIFEGKILQQLLSGF